MNVFLCSAMGKSIRFHETDVRPTGRVAGGIRGMRIDPDDRIVGMEVLSYGQTLFAVTENGYGKRTSIDEYPVQKRGGKGVITIKTSERNGMVVSILLVEETDEVMLMTDTGKIIRMPISGVSLISRNTQGVKLMGMESGEKVAGAARLAEREENGDTEDLPEDEAMDEVKAMDYLEDLDGAEDDEDDDEPDSEDQGDDTDPGI